LQWERELGREIVYDAMQIAKESAKGSLQIAGEVLTTATVPALVDLSKGAEMVVVGCRGPGTFARTALGSVSIGLLHHAHCPVAVIHDEARSTDSSFRAPVLVGADGSPASKSVIAMAFDEASGRRVELVAPHAWWVSGGI
jgi:nucleotide-binding universal stress UspA family protein